MNNFIRSAAWAGIAVFAIIFIFVILDIILLFGLGVRIIFLILLILAILMFLAGLAVTGKRFGSRLLFITMLLQIIVFVGFTLYIFLGIFGAYATPISLEQDYGLRFLNQTEKDAAYEALDQEHQASLDSARLHQQIAYIILGIATLVLTILQGIGLIFVGNKTGLGLGAGVVEIVAGATFIVFVGAFVKIAAMIMEIILMFRLSEDHFDKFRN